MEKKLSFLSINEVACDLSFVPSYFVCEVISQIFFDFDKLLKSKSDEELLALIEEYSRISYKNLNKFQQIINFHLRIFLFKDPVN